MTVDPFQPLAPLVFTPEARRMLALALLQEDDERILPAQDDDTTRLLLGLLADLGLLELVAGGYIATDFLRAQAWARELRDQPFPE